MINELFGMKIVESPLCERKVPAKRHKKRANQSVAYHERVQKKWVKRFGMKTERVAYMINPNAAGLFGYPSMLAIHPKDMVLLRNIGA